MTTVQISRHAVADAIGARLLQVTNATGYFGQIGSLYRLPGAQTSPPNDPPEKGNGDKRVRPYFILEPGIGRPGTEVDLADQLVDLELPYVVRAVAGDPQDLLALVDRIDEQLFRWAPSIPDATTQCGPLRPPPGYVPPFLTDQSFKPYRLYAPLQYQLTAHT